MVMQHTETHMTKATCIHIAHTQLLARSGSTHRRACHVDLSHMYQQPQQQSRAMCLKYKSPSQAVRDPSGVGVLNQEEPSCGIPEH